MPGMLQSGASRELFEAWAPEKKSGFLRGKTGHDTAKG